MARDNHIIRPDRPIYPIKVAVQDLTRQERIKLLVDQILPKVRDGIDARQPKQVRRKKR